MKNIIPYLTFNGKAEEALNHYKSILGGEIVSLNRFSEAPPMDGVEMTEESLNLVMNAVYVINEYTTIMASDGHPAFDEIPFGQNFSLAITAESKEEVDTFFAGLSEGGIITMPLEETFWNAYFGMCEDKFGVNWMINYDLE
ncbi:MAG: VOC family protein [Ignavibacteriae bacterium HGW-Ignavibacteriae-4]|jgi:PhnB protein|nr:MAG: VOC family protein [Ignavibacteriae bacterium HGW-Ignavibacteriae-4]